MSRKGKIVKMDLLIAVYIFCIAVSELMGGKTFPIMTIGHFKLTASVAIFVVPLIFTINDVITEVFGKVRTRSIIRSGLIVIFMILVFSLLATHLPPSKRFAGTEKAYDQIFGVSARIAAASLTAFAISEFTDLLIFVKIRQKLGKGRLWLRNNLSNFGAELVDTLVFITLAFWGLHKPFGENVVFLTGLIIPYWLLKCFISVIETPFVYLGVRWLKNEK